MIVRALPPAPTQTAPPGPAGSRCIGRYFQAFPPSEQSWDPALVEALRRFDPSLCPMWANYVYQTQAGGTFKIGRHSLWLEVPYPEVKETPPRFLPATYGPNAGRHPNVFLMPLEADRTEAEVEQDVSGAFIPFGWWLLDTLRAARQDFEPDADKRADARDAAEAEAKRKAVEKMDAEIDYRLSHDWEHLRKAAAAASDAELAMLDHGLVGDRPKKAMVEVHRGAGE